MEKISWKKLIPGCFAGEAAPFGVHPMDKKRAEFMFHSAMRAGVEMKDILKETEQYLKAQGVNKVGIAEETKRIELFKSNPLKKTKIKSAWLITKEGGKDCGKVVAILNYRKTGEYVRDFIENLYIAENYSLHEKLTYARNRKNNPYPAKFALIDGVPWQGRIKCGKSPFLLGRFVTDLIIVSEGVRNMKLEFKEISSQR